MFVDIMEFFSLPFFSKNEYSMLNVKFCQFKMKVLSIDYFGVHINCSSYSFIIISKVKRNESF